MTRFRGSARGAMAVVGAAGAAPAVWAALAIAAQGAWEPNAQEAGRAGRDPFSAEDSLAPTDRAPGLPGVALSEVLVRGVAFWENPTVRREAESAAGLAVLEAPSGEGFVAAPGAELMDGILIRIVDDGVWFLRNPPAESEIFVALGNEPPASTEESGR